LVEIEEKRNADRVSSDIENIYRS